MKELIASILCYTGIILFFGSITWFAFSESICGGFTMTGIDFILASLIIVLNKSLSKDGRM